MTEFSTLRSPLPPALRALANRLLGANIRYRGPYDDWQFAVAASSGYLEGAILNRVTKATQKVLSGQATFEQDASIFADDPPPSYALSAVLLGAGLSNGELSVLDFGGGLGSHFLRWRPWMSHLKNVRWHVVEQENYVTTATTLLADIPELSFSESLEQLAFAPNVLLASSVLQYLPNPMMKLEELILLRAKIIIIDRTPFSENGIARILTQHVPRRLGKASYPLWSFSKEDFTQRLQNKYDLVCEFQTADAPIRGTGIDATFCGSVWVLRAEK